MENNESSRMWEAEKLSQRLPRLYAKGQMSEFRCALTLRLLNMIEGIVDDAPLSHVDAELQELREQLARKELTRTISL